MKIYSIGALRTAFSAFCNTPKNYRLNHAKFLLNTDYTFKLINSLFTESILYATAEEIFLPHALIDTEIRLRPQTWQCFFTSYFNELSRRDPRKLENILVNSNSLGGSIIKNLEKIDYHGIYYDLNEAAFVDYYGYFEDLPGWKSIISQSAAINSKAQIIIQATPENLSALSVLIQTKNKTPIRQNLVSYIKNVAHLDNI